MLLRGRKVIARKGALAEAKHNYGYFTLSSNEMNDPLDALAICRNKDLVEKAFENLKERPNLRRPAVSSEQSLESKLFVQLVTLILLSHITRQMQESNLFKDYTLQEVFEELDAIEYSELPGQGPHGGPDNTTDMDIYAKLGIVTLTL